MKKCPFCNSELTDNAQFCLYCMKSLDEKTVLSASTSKKKPLPWILLALSAIFLAIIIIVLCIVFSKKAPDDKDNSLPTTQNPSISETNTASMQTAAPKPTDAPAITYSYRDATPEDDFKRDNSITDNAVVVTGIITPEESGIYYIPRKIDGKKVVAITADFSSDIKKAATVKTIIVPSTVRTVWAGALSNCVNITDVYISNSGMEESIEFGIKVLPDLDSRNFEITFHYDTSCCNRDYRLYEVDYIPDKNPDNAYHAKYEYWNPSTPID